MAITLSDAFNTYNKRLESDEANLAQELNSMTADGKTPSLAQMMSFNTKSNSLMAKTTLEMTSQANSYKLFINIAQRAVSP